MPTTTAIASGAWNADAATIWDGGVVPPDGNSFAIPAGFTVTLDADYSDLATGFAASTIGGTLQVSTSAGTYGLKLNGALTKSNDAARFNIGTSLAVPLPADVQFNLVLTATGKINMTNSGAVNWYCQAPATPWTTVKTAAGATDVKIYVDDDLTTGEWTATRYIRICDSATTYPDSEERQISSVGSDGGGDYVIVTAGLTATKAVGSAAVLCHRNVHVEGNSNTAARTFIDCVACNIGCSVRGAAYPFYGASDLVFSNGCLNGSVVNNFRECNRTISVDCSFVGVSSGFNSTAHDLFDGCLFSGNTNSVITMYGMFKNCLFTCSGNAINACSVIAKDCAFQYNSSALIRSSGTFISCSFDNNTYDLYRPNTTDLYDCGFGGLVYLVYSSNNYYWNVRSFDHDKVAGDFWSINSGGIVTNSTTEKPTGYTWSYKHAGGPASAPCFWQEEVRLAAYERAVYRVWLRKTASFATLPKAEIIDRFADPLVDSTETALAVVTMTDSTDTWERLTLTYLNNSATPKDVIVRVSAQNATGYCYSRCDRMLNKKGIGTRIRQG